MKGKIRKILLSLGVLTVSAVISFGTSVLAAPDDSVDVSDKYTDSSLTGTVDEYDEAEYNNAIDDLNKIIAAGDYEGVAVYVNDIENSELKIRVLDYLGIYYPEAYKAAIADGEVTIEVKYLGSFIGKDENGNPVEGDTSVALYNTMTAYKVGLISEITWTMTGKETENTFTASLKGTILDSDDVEKTINGDGTVSFGLIVNGAYFEEDDTPVITTEVSLNDTETVSE